MPQYKKRRKLTRADYPQRPKGQRRMKIEPYQRGYVRQSGFYGWPTGEKKFHDQNLAEAEIASALETANLNIVPQDNNPNGRVGRKIVVTDIFVRGIIELPTTTTFPEGADVVRCMLVQDKQTNGGSFLGSDLFEGGGDLVSFQNLANKNRFKVLANWWVSLNSSAAGSTSAGVVETMPTKRFIQKYVKCQIPIEFDQSAATGAVPTQRSNSIWFCLMADNNNTCSFVGRSRIRYLDG